MLERTDADIAGKGADLNWLHDRIVETTGSVPFDAFVVIDADTVVDPDFLRAMHGPLSAGTRVAQGFYGVRDPDHSPSAGCCASADEWVQPEPWEAPPGWRSPGICTS